MSVLLVPFGRCSAYASITITTEMPITAVNLEEFRPTASEILRAAWKPPCLDYSQEYLAWQFGFPTDLEPIALAVYHDGEPVAFVAATGRLTNLGPVYMSSFMSILPGTPSSAAIGIIRQESRILKNSGLPTIVFTQKGSVGEQLLAVGETVGVKHHPLGEYRVYAAAPHLQPSSVEVVAVSSSEWLEAANCLRSNDLLSLSFDPATLRHLEADPFGREFLIARKNGTPHTVAMLSETRSITSTGKQSTPTLHYVRVRDDDPDPLSALLYYARARGAVVNVPNVTRISPNLRKAVGLRATPSVFTGHVVTNAGPLRFSACELEIV
jgi:hypothetical protein